MNRYVIIPSFVAALSFVNGANAQQTCADGSTTLCNGASNETIVMEGSNFGDDTVMNFTTDGANPALTCENGGLPASECPAKE